MKRLGTGSGAPLKQRNCVIRFSMCKQGWASEGQADAVTQARGGNGTLKSGGIQVAAHGG